MTCLRLRAIAAMLALVAAPAIASSATAGQDCSESGVWLGTIGKASVSMAFSDGTGRYYYGNSAMDLVLTRDGARTDRWIETSLKGKRTGLLTLSCGDTLTGTWTDASGARAAPILAARPAPRPDDADADVKTEGDADEQKPDAETVAVEAYLRARKANPPAVRRIAERMGPHRFVRYGIHDFGAVGAELQGKERGIQTINGVLRKQYEGLLANAWGCTYWALTLGGPGRAEEFASYDRVAFWHGSTVVIETSESACGRESTIDHRRISAYDTTTGKSVDWPHLSYERRRPAPAALMAALATHYRASEAGRTARCEGFLGRRIHIEGWPEQDGLVVTLALDVNDPSAASLAECEERLTLPFDDALPLLEPGDRRMLQGLLAQP
ncbi:hypothetical protein [Mitsuaria sp. 7]|uniref:hypothetical protein n=1 Tax=Mitsuaria sp. 7 TaxID=1658665 RepID=UPI0007DD5125|nr:hypothetical protein [Mitsuaria sp. 7]ANH67797.1 hypothetical protein ABE85_09805 [Mitsuaria sp. 7]